MKKLIFSLLAIALVAGHLAAQDITATPTNQTTPAASPIFGYLSYNAILTQLPEYAEAQQQFQQLRQKYDDEAQRAEDEFQRKFSEFLQGQKDFPRSIMQKRQTELQNLLLQSVAFRQQAQQLLADAQAELLRPARQRLDKAIADVAARLTLICVINTDNDAAPYLDPARSIDLTPHILNQLGIATPNP